MLYVEDVQKQRSLVEIHASFFNSLEPVYGIQLAFLFSEEIPAARTVLGGLIILWAAVSLTLGGITEGKHLRSDNNATEV